MDKIKGRLGFGFMRLPTNGDEVDMERTRELTDAFMGAGFNYFDTAHGYLEGRSETALRECLTSRYPRESYVLTDKLTVTHFSRQEDIRPLFESQLAACGVSYFDFYLMHSQGASIFAKFKSCRAYETALELKAEGKFRHFGISFHDRAAVLRQILDEYPQIEVVQLQFNYADYDDAVIESRKCYELCVEYGKPVIVMEPVKGGTLADLPAEARAVFDALGGGSPASYAIRFAAGFEGVMMVLSGMGDMAQMSENTDFMRDFKPLSERERAAVQEVLAVFRAQELIPCTSCRYCTEVCQQRIAIPEMFACLNSKKRHGGWNSDYYYSEVLTNGAKKASDCIGCGKCERVCPQHLRIRKLLEQVAKTFERDE